ncbi:hypothetical protein ASD45_08595 [Pseudolabrys sp. Root1462]|nr:hypothetical protein ASD45_08595 [Pseudolabrys sp. Root1462]
MLHNRLPQWHGAVAIAVCAIALLMAAAASIMPARPVCDAVLPLVTDCAPSGSATTSKRIIDRADFWHAP